MLTVLLIIAALSSITSVVLTIALGLVSIHLLKLTDRLFKWWFISTIVMAISIMLYSSLISHPS